MKRRYVQDKSGRLVPVEEYYRAPVAPLVMPDIAEYTSMIDGSRIGSRSQHREHLKAHGCVEIGNEKINTTPRGIPDADPKHRKELIVAQVQEFGRDGLRRALRRDIDFIKWNSNGLPRAKE